MVKVGKITNFYGNFVSGTQKIDYKSKVLQIGTKQAKASNKMTTTSNTMYFYKGTTFPIVSNGDGFPKLINKWALDMIIKGEKMGVSREQQIKDYKEQLDVMEQVMTDIQAEMGVPENDKDAQDQLDALCEECGKDQTELQAIWCINIASLLLMKALKQDDFNGTMTQTFILPKKK